MRRPPRARILVVEDDDSFARSLVSLLQQEGMAGHVVHDSRSGLRAFREQPFDVILLDLLSPADEGLPLLEEIRARSAQIPVLMMSASPSVETAVEAMKLGATDYLTRPVRTEDLVSHIRRLARLTRYRRPDSPEEASSGDPVLVGRSRAARALLRDIGVVSRADATVLITGESGAGKDLTARMIHSRSSRARAPFVKVRCPLLQDATPQTASRSADAPATRLQWPPSNVLTQGATLFFDEVAEMPPPLQVRLLELLHAPVLEQIACAGAGPLEAQSTAVPGVDVRVLCSTSTDLSSRVRSGTFREDLYYRLGAVTIRVPPLRDRRSDISLLAEHILGQVTRSLGKPLTGFSPSCLKLLEAHPWPGNVRQLENLIERAVLFCQTKTVTVADLGPELRRADASGPDGSQAEFDIQGHVREAARSCILRALAATGGNRTRAAGLLGISRKTLWEKMRDLRVDAD